MRQDSSGAFLYTLSTGLITGVALALTFSLGVVYPLLMVGSALALLMLGAALATPWQGKFLLLAAILFVSLVLGFVRADLFLITESQETISTFAGNATVAGYVSNDPQVSGMHLQTDVQAVSVNGTPAKGTLLAFLPPQSRLSYGQQVTLQGELEAPTSFMGDNGNAFDYPAYLRVQSVSMLLNQAHVSSAQPAGISLQGTLFSIKHHFEVSLGGVLPEPDASLLEGILLGARRGLPAELTQAFALAGLIHIVILSGYSMSVVSEGILRALKFLPRRSQMFFAAVCMILFVLMTGAAATTVRACLMALVALTARYFHRSALALRSLAVVAAAMVLFDPPLILGDASFFTSVLATFGLIAFSPSIEGLLWRVPQRYGMRAIITSTIAVQIFALPALLYFTGNLSFLSVPANLLVLPLLPLIMIGGLLTGLLGFVSPVVAFVPALITDLLLKWILLVVRVVQVIPFASTTVIAFPLWLAVAMYMPLTALAIWLLKRNALQ